MIKEIKKEIITYLLLFFVFIFVSLFFAFQSSATPSGESGSHHNSTSSNDAKLLNYVSNSASEYDQLLYGLSNNVFNDVADSYSAFLYYFVPESMLTSSEKEILGYFDDINQGTENPSIIFDIDDSFNWTIKDEYKTDYDSLIDKLCTSINNQYLLYPTKSGDFLSNNPYPDYSPSDALNNLTSNFNVDDFPVFFQRNNDSYGFASLENLNNDSSIDVDGFVFQYGDWSYLVNNWEAYVNNGYLPNINNQGVTSQFYLYSNGLAYTDNSSLKIWSSRNVFSQPFRVPIYIYDSYRDYTRDITAIIGKSDIPMLFFRDYTAYDTFYRSKMAIPFDFSGLDIPANFDYTQFFKSIDRNLIDAEHSLDVLYSYLNEQLSKQIQEIIDSQRTTNELLLALLRYYDKNIVKGDNNITELMLSMILELQAIGNNLNNGNDESEDWALVTETIISDPSIENRLKHIFPFGFYQDAKDLIDEIDNIGSKNPVFTFEFKLLYSEQNKQEFVVDFSELPFINIFRQIFNILIIVFLNIGCLFIELHFLKMFFGGG